jgi:hypothetical protein
MREGEEGKRTGWSLGTWKPFWTLFNPTLLSTPWIFVAWKRPTAVLLEHERSWGREEDSMIHIIIRVCNLEVLVNTTQPYSSLGAIGLHLLETVDLLLAIGLLGMNQ